MRIFLLQEKRAREVRVTVLLLWFLKVRILHLGIAWLESHLLV